MRKTQRGITFIGWLFLLVPIAIVGYSALRLAPMYMTYGKVARVMEQTAKESRATDPAAVIRASLEKRLDIEGIEFPTLRDFGIRRDGQSWMLEIEYEDGAPLLSNVSITAKFNKSVRLGTAPE